MDEYESKLEEYNRLVSMESGFEDTNENILRPRTFDEYVGQDRVVDNLKIFIKAAKQRGEPLDHVLLYGPPGLGKTTLASIIASEMGVNIRVTSGPAIEKAADLTGILSKLNEYDVLFIDEIHRLHKTVEEILYSAMEDYAVDVVMGKGPMAHSLRLNLPKFTLIGATTRAGLLTAPLRDRFGVINRLELYTPEQLSKIIKRSANILCAEIENDGAYLIAKRSRGTPRIANRLLKRARDFAQVYGDGIITEEIADRCLTALEIDELGLDNIDRNVLETIITKFGGGPVGLETLSAATGEDMRTIEDVYEPYFIQLGFINKTPRGRMATPAAYKHMGIPFDNE